MEYRLPKEPWGLPRTLPRQQNLLSLEAEVIVRSQTEVVPRALYIYKTPLTKESQGTAHLDFLKCQWLRTTENRSKHDLYCSPEYRQERKRVDAFYSKHIALATLS